MTTSTLDYEIKMLYSKYNITKNTIHNNPGTPITLTMPADCDIIYTIVVVGKEKFNKLTLKFADVRIVYRFNDTYMYKINVPFRMSKTISPYAYVSCKVSAFMNIYMISYDNLVMDPCVENRIFAEYKKINNLPLGNLSAAL
jgi:hypothetical protein